MSASALRDLAVAEGAQHGAARVLQLHEGVQGLERERRDLWAEKAEAPILGSFYEGF